MLEKLFPRKHGDYTNSPAGQDLEVFATWLVAKRYSIRQAKDHVCRLKGALEQYKAVPRFVWSAVEMDNLFSPAVVRGRRKRRLATQHVFERHLMELGQLTLPPLDEPFIDLLSRYQHHLVQLRGLAPHTVNQHLATIRSFLSRAIPGAVSLHKLSVTEIEQFLNWVGSKQKRQSLQHTIAHLRAFLRFCYDHREITSQLDVIDMPRVYRGESPPRALPWSMVQALLNSVDRADRTGCRDYTILYLLAYYGLRPVEVVSLHLDSIDWQRRTLRVAQQKTRSYVLFPLMDDAIKVLREYVRSGRPHSDLPFLFLRVCCPSGPIGPTAVRRIFIARVKRSGLPIATSAPYSLRHAFAMRLLEGGVGVKAIGDLLGHHSLESTCVYLRLDIKALRHVGLCLPANTCRVA